VTPWRISPGPFLWGARVDLSIFGGSALAALALAAGAAAFCVGEVTDVAWMLLVLGVDVAHVHATWFRTYLDRAELRRHPLRYVLVPLLGYALGWLAYRDGALTFWRVLAYVAAFHFVRQQVGWVALYRAAEARQRPLRYPRLERWSDYAAIYAATLYPLFEWHCHAQTKAFAWFVPGDFVRLGFGRALPLLGVAYAVCLGVFALRELCRAIRFRSVALGRSVVVSTTALTWYMGIVAAKSDFVFTALNVIPHGVPYVWLLFVYARARSRSGPAFSWGQIAEAGFSSFLALLVGLAFVEEMAWDRLVDHDRAWLFGSSSALRPELLGWVVPLLALPQLTHYLLDGLLWRRSESRSREAQRAAVGFDAAAPPARGLEVAAPLLGVESRGAE
jgi:hypothetical protein